MARGSPPDRLLLVSEFRTVCTKSCPPHQAASRPCLRRTPSSTQAPALRNSRSSPASGCASSLLAKLHARLSFEGRTSLEVSLFSVALGQAPGHAQSPVPRPAAHLLLRRSGHQDRRPLEAALAQVGESLVRCSQWVTDRLGPY